MNTLKFITTGLSALLLASCGYHLGGVKPEPLKDKDTFCVEVFENSSLHPSAGVLMTTALANALQSDGTYRMAPRGKADFIVKGEIERITRESLITNTEDTYVSTQIAVCVTVGYQVIDNKTGKVLCSGQEVENASFFNEDGSKESATESALSYATRRIADDITLHLVTK
ncbi:MAG: hypothetical protein IKJ29_04700 [Akkermansia sp.]|nr:hypothetical protein [Akkermansia sp.]